MRTILFLLPLTLAACAEPMIRDSDVIRTGTDPAYTYGDGGGVVPTSCLGGASRYSGTPSGCQRDLAFARQVVNPSDLVEPTPPGAGSAGTVGRAADRYVNPDASRPAAIPPDVRQRGTPRRILPQQEVPADPYAGAGPQY
ncbi:hypothetical protein [Paracoccus laeviglucosivorans]|uniref:Pilus biogenesis CpaD protein (Pilus_cpaD) n=1 Tax=Paracoccus laeviglucosivorans TaxID=1197861 RepID=A0A521BE62_9RHOB|nr:hypothetical protein [Paracoccus laeviglucosivorans]SMO45030.1 hypothetical protein SAMN06265221_102242 [Paracoccus laeviglucosivorans]